MNQQQFKILEDFWGYCFSILGVIPIFVWLFNPMLNIVDVMFDYWFCYAGAFICWVALVLLDRLQYYKQKGVKNES